MIRFPEDLVHEPLATPSDGSDPESLLGHAAWVRRLARALVKGGDPAADSDDVEQQTWLAALHGSRPATNPERTNPRGWLRAVARNVARRFARDHAARQRREEAAAPDEALAPVDDAVARAELHGRVVAAVLALGEPYRSTLIRRFLDEETPSRIAALDRVPVETVKTRLKRGLALLRARFAQDLGERGGARDWRQALLALFPPGAARDAVLAGSGTAIAASMRWKLVAATLAAVVTFASFVTWAPARGRSASSAAAAAGERKNGAELGPIAAVAAPAVAAARERFEPAAPATPFSDPSSPARAVPRFRIAGVVRDPAGVPVADAWVWFSDARTSWAREPTTWFSVMAGFKGGAGPAGPDGPGGFDELARTRTGPDGRFEFVTAERASWRVAAWHGLVGAALSEVCVLDPGRPAEPEALLDLTLRPTVGLRGRFVDDRGLPVSQATLDLTIAGGSRPIRLSCPLPWLRRDDATFELPPMPAVAFRGFASAFGHAGASFEIDATTSRRIHEVELVMPRKPGRIRVGRIVVPNGTGSLADDLLPGRREWELDGSAGLASARVACSVVRFAKEPPTVGTRFARDGAPVGEVRLADGTYELDRPAAEASRFLGLVVREVVVAVAEDRTVDGGGNRAPDLLVDATLVPREPATGVLRVRLLDARERARDRAGESLWVMPFGGTTSCGLWMPVGAGATPDELLVEHVPAGRVSVHYTLPGVVRIAGEADVEAGRESTLELKLRSGRGTIHGFLGSRRDETASAVRDVKLYARRDGRTILPALEAAIAVGEGFFSFDSLAPGEYALLWQGPSGPAVAIVPASEEPEPRLLESAGGIDVTIAAHFATGQRPGAMLLRVLRMDGTPEVDEIGTHAWEFEAGGERAVKVAPGRHLVQLFADGALPAEAELDTSVTTRLDVSLRRR